MATFEYKGIEVFIDKDLSVSVCLADFQWSFSTDEGAFYEGIEDSLDAAMEAAKKCIDDNQHISFENYELLPKSVQKILASIEEEQIDCDLYQKIVTALEKRGFTSDYSMCGSMVGLARIIDTQVEVYPMKKTTDNDSQLWTRSQGGQPDCYSIMVVKKGREDLENYLEIDDIPERHINKLIEAACKRFNCSFVSNDF